MDESQLDEHIWGNEAEMFDKPTACDWCDCYCNGEKKTSNITGCSAGTQINLDSRGGLQWQCFLPQVAFLRQTLPSHAVWILFISTLLSLSTEINEKKPPTTTTTGDAVACATRADASHQPMKCSGRPPITCCGRDSKTNVTLQPPRWHSSSEQRKRPLVISWKQANQ